MKRLRCAYIGSIACLAFVLAGCQTTPTRLPDGVSPVQATWLYGNYLILPEYTIDNWAEAGFAGHLIMGSACTLVGGKPAAPAGTPVLAIVGANDE